MEESESLSCPSHRCKAGSQILGMRQDDGTVAIFPTPLPVTEEFIAIVKQDETAPERRFRFTNKCVESGCNQWTGKGCGVVERFIQNLEDMTKPSQLPECGIRHKCRWFHQRKEEACKVCLFVITEITIEEVLELQKNEPEDEGY